MDEWIYQNIIDELQIKDEIDKIIENVDDYIEGEVIVYTPP